MSRFVFANFATIIVLLSGCTVFESQVDSEKEDVIGIIDGTAVTLQEMEQQYDQSRTLMSEELDESDGFASFLDLYMDYRLKLAIAEDAGYLQDPAILQELEEYERQSAYPFWIERDVKDHLLEELYERSAELIHAQHILIALGDNPSPADTAEAYNKLMEARNRFLEDEEDFMNLSESYSSR